MATQEDLTKTGKESNSETSGNDVGNPPSNTQLFLILARVKLKVVASYVMDGFAPLVASLALILAVYNYQAIHGKSDKADTKIVSINAALIESKTELSKLKEAILKDKITLEAERKKIEERESRLIHHITQLEIQMKISPTLEEEFHPATKPLALMPASAVSATKAVPAIVAPIKETQPKAVPPVIEKKSNERAQVLKEAIEKFNKK